ncbi:syntaxin-8-like [Dysidea avara]|uniref:syntaxin-8-like n=1 Tax=Dysidea avara TaxID=196820 RepID=UPI0033207044
MDSWMTEYYNLADLGSRIWEQLSRRDQRQQTRANMARVNEDIRSLLSAYNKSLLSLKSSLARASTSYHITDREYERRQQLVDELTTKQRQYEIALHSLDGSASSRAPLNPFPTEETDTTRNMDTSALRQEQQRIIEEQDRGLEALSNALRRQKKMGQQIGEEVEYQTGMIEDLGGETERVDLRIQRETRRIETTTRKRGNCVLWCIAVLLFIVIVVFMAIPRQ